MANQEIDHTKCDFWDGEDAVSSIEGLDVEMFNKKGYETYELT